MKHVNKRIKGGKKRFLQIKNNVVDIHYFFPDTTESTLYVEYFQFHYIYIYIYR